MFGWANIRNQNLFVGVLGGEIFFFGFRLGFEVRSRAFEVKNIIYYFIK